MHCYFKKNKKIGQIPVLGKPTYMTSSPQIEKKNASLPTPLFQQMSDISNSTFNSLPMFFGLLPLGCQQPIYRLTDQSLPGKKERQHAKAGHTFVGYFLTLVIKDSLLQSFKFFRISLKFFLLSLLL